MYADIERQNEERWDSAWDSASSGWFDAFDVNFSTGCGLGVLVLAAGIVTFFYAKKLHENKIEPTFKEFQMYSVFTLGVYNWHISKAKDKLTLKKYGLYVLCSFGYYGLFFALKNIYAFWKEMKENEDNDTHTIGKKATATQPKQADQNDPPTKSNVGLFSDDDEDDQSKALAPALVNRKKKKAGSASKKVKKAEANPGMFSDNEDEFSEKKEPKKKAAAHGAKPSLRDSGAVWKIRDPYDLYADNSWTPEDNDMSFEEWAEKAELKPADTKKLQKEMTEWGIDAPNNLDDLKDEEVESMIRSAKIGGRAAKNVQKQIRWYKVRAKAATWHAQWDDNEEITKANVAVLAAGVKKTANIAAVTATTGAKLVGGFFTFWFQIIKTILKWFIIAIVSFFLLNVLAKELPYALREYPEKLIPATFVIEFLFLLRGIFRVIAADYRTTNNQIAGAINDIKDATKITAEEQAARDKITGSLDKMNAAKKKNNTGHVFV